MSVGQVTRVTRVSPVTPDFMRIWRHAAGIVFLVTHQAVAQSIAPAVLRSVALRVVELEVRRQLTEATPATVDSLLALYSDSVVYPKRRRDPPWQARDAPRHALLHRLSARGCDRTAAGDRRSERCRRGDACTHGDPRG